MSNTARDVVDAIGIAPFLELLNIDVAEDEWKRRGPRRPHGHHGFRDEPQI